MLSSNKRRLRVEETSGLRVPVAGIRFNVSSERTITFGFLDVVYKGGAPAVDFHLLGKGRISNSVSSSSF